MKQHERFEIAALGVFAGMLVILMATTQSTSAASQVPGGNCTLAFNGDLTSVQMNPMGSWALQSTSCEITDESNGVTSGTFTGSFTSGPSSSIVSGSWSIAGSTQKIVASSTTFTVSFSVDNVGNVPVLTSALQGTLWGTGGQSMFTVGTVGQITIR